MVAAFFDLDHTITDRDSFRLFLKTFYLKKSVNLVYLPYIFIYLILRKFRIISLKQFKELALIGLRHRHRKQIRQIGDLFFKNYLKKTLRKQAIKRIKKHQQNGDYVFIVSASPDIYVHAVSEYLNCDGYVCSNLDYDTGRFTGKFFGPDCIGAEKKRQIYLLSSEHGIDLKNSWAYSDHEADLQFFESVGKKVAVTPTKKLFDIARNNNWKIEAW
jgi:HAD superfamily hydrolase (TIGR01490 family)